MTLYNKLLAYTLLAGIVLTACYAASLGSYSGSITISFGKQPKSQYLAMLETALPIKASELRSGR